MDADATGTSFRATTVEALTTVRVARRRIHSTRIQALLGASDEAVGSVNPRAMARSKNPNPFVRGRRVSAGKQGNEAAANAIALAKDAKSFGVQWQSIVDGSGFSDEDKGPLRRAGAALGI